MPTATKTADGKYDALESVVLRQHNSLARMLGVVRAMRGESNPTVIGHLRLIIAGYRTALQGMSEAVDTQCRLVIGDTTTAKSKRK